MKQRKTPLRRCTGCREMLDKNQLVRVVRIEGDAGGEFRIDYTGKANGRGAYICKNTDCFDKAVKSKGLERSFKAKIPPDIYENIKRDLEASLSHGQ